MVHRKCLFSGAWAAGSGGGAYSFTAVVCAGDFSMARDSLILDTSRVKRGTCRAASLPWFLKSELAAIPK